MVLKNTLKQEFFYILKSSYLVRIKHQPRKINQLTPFIDAGTIYGANDVHLKLLMDDDGMRLKMRPDTQRGKDAEKPGLLPGLALQ